MTNTNYLSNWNYKEFKTYSEINSFIEKLKNKLIGKKLKEFWIMGIEFDSGSKDYLELDEPIMLVIDDEIHLEIDYSSASEAKIGINSLTRNEFSYQTKNNNWHKAPEAYFRNILDKKITNIIVQQRFTPPTIEDPFLEFDRSDLYSAIGIEFENKACLIIDAWIDYMQINVASSSESILKPMDRQLVGPVYSKDPEIKDTDYKISCPYCGSKTISKYIYDDVDKQTEFDIWCGKAILTKTKKDKDSPEYLCCICGKNFSNKKTTTNRKE